MKTPLRNPKTDHEWRTTLALAGVIALLCVAIVIVAAMRYFFAMSPDALGPATRTAMHQVVRPLTVKRDVSSHLEP